MLYSLIISPIETIVDIVFRFISSKFQVIGIIGAVCGVSLIINFLALPLYNVADALQDKERKAAKALEPRVKRIKKAFKGNEQFMMLSTYYRQNNYHPLYVLRSSLSILIEIPFFIAAYHYLSNCEALRGASFWIFKDLGSPDGLLHIGSFPIHILPIIMTLINFVSGAIYTKDAVFREKIQLYIVALLFLVLLYNSPSGLVIYWILNNLFSLVKNIVMKMKHPGRILHIFISALLIVVTFYLFKFRLNMEFSKKLVALFVTLVITLLPLEKKLIQKIKFLKFEYSKKGDFLILLFSGIGLALLCGFVIPSSTIASSVGEFSFLGSTASPVTYIKNSFFVFAGFFILWPIVIYKMFGPNVKKFLSLGFFLAFILALANVYIFKPSYGNLNFLFEVENDAYLNTSKKIYLLSVLAFFAFVAVFLVLKKFKKENILATVLSAFSIGLCVLGFYKVSKVNSGFKIYEQNKTLTQKVDSVQKEYNLSKTEKNVVVFFLDRGINSFVSRIFEEFPEIKNQFAGFVYYPNTLSFSTHTVTGSPALMGGYEYNQENMNARADEKLREKHNEALMVMPKLFADAGFEVTVTDPPWPNYYWKGDLAFADKVPEAKISEIIGKYYDVYKEKLSDKERGEGADTECKNACIDFAVLQCLPPFTRKIYYTDFRRKSTLGTVGKVFYNNFANLYYLPEMTDLSSTKNTFTFIDNETTHEPNVDLAEDFETIASMQSYDEYSRHYQANVAAFKQLGKWLDYLRQNDVYDNTRIVLVSDHGRDLQSPDYDKNLLFYSALLLEKDFNSNAPVQTNNDFMMNADTLFLAKKDLPVSNINPFTKKEFVQQKDGGVNVYLCVDWNAEHFREAKQFELNKNHAFHVSGDIYKKENWIPLNDWENQNAQNGGSK